MKTGKTGDFYQEKGLRFKTYRSKKKKCPKYVYSP